MIDHVAQPHKVLKFRCARCGKNVHKHPSRVQLILSKVAEVAKIFKK